MDICLPPLVFLVVPLKTMEPSRRERNMTSRCLLRERDCGGLLFHIVRCFVFSVSMVDWSSSVSDTTASFSSSGTPHIREHTRAGESRARGMCTQQRSRSAELWHGSGRAPCCALASESC